MKVMEAQNLIVSAFEQARSTGKPDWNKMTAAVLKNRLLDLTRGAFDETAYGATSFTDFVLRNDDILHLDRSVLPQLVELLETAQLSRPSSAAIEITGRCRIRSDLWKAALDYSSGARYLWDAVSGSATPSEAPDDKLIISPATLELQSDWRKQFKADVMATLTADESVNVDHWIDQNGASSQLPSRLKSRWNGFFCEHVRQHLLRWFAESKIPAPSDLALSTTGKASITWSETEALRKLVLSVVRQMTRQELSSLALPSEAVLPSEIKRGQERTRLGTSTGHAGARGPANWGPSAGHGIALGCYAWFAHERLEDGVKHGGDLEDPTSWPRQHLSRRPCSQRTALYQGLRWLKKRPALERALLLF